MKRITLMVSGLVLALASLWVPVSVSAGGGGPSCGTDGTPVAYNLASDYRGSVPHTVQFNAAYSLGCDDQITDYQWSFGDGTTASGITAEHTFTAAGSWSVSLQVTDEASLTDSHNITIVTRDNNQVPVAVDDSFAFTNNSNSAEHFLSVRTNDSDPEGDYMTQAATSQPTHGTLRTAGSYAFYYTPEAGYYGPDSFTYQLTDDYGGVSNTAVVTINNVRPIVAPSANDDTVVVDEDQSVTIDVYANDSDDLPLTATAVVTQTPIQGSVQSNGGGSFTYTPNANYYGTDSFYYQITDSDGQTDQARVSITVNSIYDPIPVNAVNDAFSTSEDTLATGTVSANDIVDSIATATVSLVTSPQHGVLQLDPSGSFSYTPAADYYGSDSFSYRITDSLGTSDVATVALSVASVNDVPVANFSYLATNKPREFKFSNLSTDPENNSLTYSWDFGDGVTSTVISPAHRYARKGTFTATLTTIDSNGSTATVSKTVIVF